MDPAGPRPDCECPGCGRPLPETVGDWKVYDGQPLGCGCDGGWSVDEDGANAMHDDDCRQCIAEEGE